MPVAIRGGAALDGGVRREGVRPGVALLRPPNKIDRNRLLTACDYNIRNSDRSALPECAEIWMKSSSIADVGDQISRVGVDGKSRDVHVPGIIGREWTCTVQTRADPEVWYSS